MTFQLAVLLSAALLGLGWRWCTCSPGPPLEVLMIGLLLHNLTRLLPP